MNPGFYTLPEQRKNQIINAGFRIFSQNSYRKAPVAEIAAEAGISKALLFYHFKNKKDLYLFLWQTAVTLTSQELQNQKILETRDLFEMMERSLRGKCILMEKYPYAGEFSLKAYYEQDPEIASEIQQYFQELNQQSEEIMLSHIDTSNIRKDLDLHTIYEEMVWAADGYMHRMMLKGAISPEQINRDFIRLIQLWKKAYEVENYGGK